MTTRSRKTVQEKGAMEDPKPTDAVIAESAGPSVEDALASGHGPLTEDEDRAKQEEDAKVAFEDAVRVTSNGHDRVVRRGEIIVVCRDPGFRRAGIEHPAMAVYSRWRLEKKQLEQMRAEPLLEIIEVG